MLPAVDHWKADLNKYTIVIGNGYCLLYDSEKKAKKAVTAINTVYNDMFVSININLGLLYNAWKGQVSRKFVYNQKISGLFIDAEFNLQKAQKKYSQSRFQAVQIWRAACLVYQISEFMRKSYPIMDNFCRSISDKATSDKIKLKFLGENFEAEVIFYDSSALNE